MVGHNASECFSEVSEVKWSSLQHRRVIWGVKKFVIVKEHVFRKLHFTPLCDRQGKRIRQDVRVCGGGGGKMMDCGRITPLVEYFVQYRGVFQLR